MGKLEFLSYKNMQTRDINQNLSSQGMFVSASFNSDEVSIFDEPTDFGNSNNYGTTFTGNNFVPGNTYANTAKSSPFVVNNNDTDSILKSIMNLLQSLLSGNKQVRPQNKRNVVKDEPLQTQNQQQPAKMDALTATKTLIEKFDKFDNAFGNRGRLDNVAAFDELAHCAATSDDAKVKEAAQYFIDHRTETFDIMEGLNDGGRKDNVFSKNELQKFEKMLQTVKK